jgi:hypothetical protein
MACIDIRIASAFAVATAAGWTIAACASNAYMLQQGDASAAYTRDGDAGAGKNGRSRGSVPFRLSRTWIRRSHAAIGNDCIVLITPAKGLGPLEGCVPSNSVTLSGAELHVPKIRRLDADFGIKHGGVSTSRQVHVRGRRHRVWYT